MKIIASSTELMRLGYAVGNAKKSGDKQKITKAKRELRKYEDFIKNNDVEMATPLTF